MVWTTSYHHYDVLGSTRQLTDGAEDVTDSFDYSAWGNEIQRSGSTSTPFTWNGKWGYYWEEGQKTYQVRQRPYSASVGSWLTVDQLGLIAANNLIEYASNNPINMIDPSGLISVSLPAREVSSELCGGYKMPFNIKFEKEATGKSLLFQKVCFRFDYSICGYNKDKAICNQKVCSDKRPPKCFWEVTVAIIPPGARGKAAIITDRIGGTPFSLPGACPNTVGDINDTGEYRRYELTKDILSELDGWQKSPATIHGLLLNIGDLYTTDPKNAKFWNTPPLESGERWSAIIWNCCPKTGRGKFTAPWQSIIYNSNGGAKTSVDNAKIGVAPLRPSDGPCAGRKLDDEGTENSASTC
jgi:RHS repeat-associated protein